MNLNLKFRDRLYALGSWFVQELDQVVASIRASWDPEHHDDGTHGDIHATSLTVRKGTPQEIASGIKSGIIDTDASVVATGTGTFGGNVVAQSLAPTTAKTTIGLVGNNSTLNDGWLGAGADAAGVWAWGMASSGGADRRYAISDLVAGMTPVLVRRDAGGNYYVQPGPVSKAAGMLAWLGNPNDSFANGYWDGVYARAYYRNFPTVAEGDWQAYTPAMLAVTLGNGTLTGRYTMIGNTVHFDIFLLFGTTTTVAAATQIGFSTPTAFSAAAAAKTLATWLALDNNTSILYHGPTHISASPNFLLDYPNYAGAAGSLGAVADTAPFTWTTSDQIWVHGTYEKV